MVSPAPIPIFDEDVLERFWSKVNKNKNDKPFSTKIDPKTACWVWTGSCDRQGYGYFKVAGYAFYAHRISWMINYGAIPKNRWICHTCDNPPCIRIDHLWLGTHEMNVRDMVVKKTMSLSPGQFRYLFMDYSAAMSPEWLEKEYKMKYPTINLALSNYDFDEFQEAKKKRKETIEAQKRKKINEQKARESYRSKIYSSYGLE